MSSFARPWELAHRHRMFMRLSGGGAGFEASTDELDPAFGGPGNREGMKKGPGFPKAFYPTCTTLQCSVALF